MSRRETAAATRRALLAEAGALLDEGGPSAVTLREVGARAGVSRGAPYGHFNDKESLLTAVVVAGWERMGDEMHALTLDADLSDRDRLQAALIVVIALSRRRPYLYQLMFSPPTSDPAAVARAAQRTSGEFLDMAVAVFGERDAHRCAIVLLTGVHGAAGLERSGLLSTDEWHTTADELVVGLLDLVDDAARSR